MILSQVVQRLKPLQKENKCRRSGAWRHLRAVKLPSLVSTSECRSVRSPLLNTTRSQRLALSAGFCKSEVSKKMCRKRRIITPVRGEKVLPISIVQACRPNYRYAH